ncbi:BnaA09g41550D [Brassica napus]|uniref:BnaA09g41550D protein n=1 Tax=Brassica napus TaxID=3708 RepID=A0A078HD93_BRANA|nr:BnaA09g41550D [Brassica napus]
MAAMISFCFQSCFIFALLFFFSTLFLFAFLFKKPKNDLPPSPPSLPVIDFLLLFASIHKTFEKITSTYGPFLQLRILNLRIVLVSSASVIHEIFKAQDINVSSRGAVAIDECMVFGSFGFIRAPYGDYWKFMKKLIMTKVLGPQALERSRGVREVELERRSIKICWIRRRRKRAWI